MIPTKRMGTTMSENWKCVTVHSPNDSEPIAYMVDNQQQFTRVNKKKGLPESHILIIRQNGFKVTVHDDEDCYDD